ncbi:Methyltransferase domain-containing protein [Mesorhizobium albiziae]|uniref:Methyltransferase domain-containing protein n=1 Tax=Neomesorhizobium albiziae TaxID=335020 RepID=A0A1I4EKV1_9HYPH|nr:class I SAM-dependent methyltransferase [Mesorhizobium albiziae]GLS32040.1 hypothetical protein GCM10007937_37500 [Mesorhizobium albiziae]SFL05167.1 Methyltransferase domain-containing protein [Mesorhizobium albiziae]
MGQSSSRPHEASANWAIYTGAAAYYQSTRPGYPDGVVQTIVDALPDICTPIIAVDVGCGTGIFTRHIADALKTTDKVIGIEPNDDMRREAFEASKAYRNIELLSGSSDHIPIDDEKAALVTAASAAHWFNLEKYYEEAARALRLKGVIAIVQNKLRWWDSEFLAQYEAFHERFLLGYRRGTFPNQFGGFSEETFWEDLARHPDFSNVRRSSWKWTRTLVPDEFETLSLSTSHTRRALAENDAAAVMAELRRILEASADAEGKLIVPYVTEVTIAERNAVPSRI